MNDPAFLHETERDLAFWRERAEVAETGLAQAIALLREVTDELSCWGMGDMHYGPQAQERRVREPVEKARAFLAAHIAESAG